MYGVEFSKATISSITDKIIPLLKEWQQRPLESIYPFVWLDAIHYKIKENGSISLKQYIPYFGLSGKKRYWGYTYLKMKVLTFGYKF